MFRKFLVVTAFFASLTTANAALYNLTCVLNDIGANGCQNNPSFGTVSITDTGLNQVTVTVSLAANNKFRDLLLNFGGFAQILTLSDASNNPLQINFNNFSMPGYNAGNFDIASTSAQGWDTNANTPYSAVITGSETLNAAMFNFLDTGNNVYVALHIQQTPCTGQNGVTNPPNCNPLVQGEQSIKIGGVADVPSDEPVPEPTTFALLASGLIAAVLLRRRK